MNTRRKPRQSRAWSRPLDQERPELRHLLDANDILQLRADTGLSQRRLAEFADVPPGAVVRAERGQDIALGHLGRISRLLRLLTGNQSSERKPASR